MTSDLKARLDAMVREKMGGVSRSHPTTPFKLAGALGHVALDLLQERDALKDRLDAAEARVESLKLETKALTAERDELQRQLDDAIDALEDEGVDVHRDAARAAKEDRDAK